MNKFDYEYKEAIEHFEKYINNDCYTDKMQKYCKIAIKSIEKDIPKKPKLSYDGDYCPNCNIKIDWQSHLRCPNCGQNMDWSDYNA